MLRRRLFAWRMRRAIHPERFAAFGERSLIIPPAVILSPHRIRIGDDVVVHDRAWFSVVEEHRGRRFEPLMSIGDRTSIGRDVWFSCVGRIEIGSDVLVGDRTLIADSHHGYEDVTRPIAHQPMADPAPVSIGDGAHLGVGVSVMAGVTIGRNVYVGAAAVVTRSVPDHCVVIGNPARVIRWYDRERERWVEGAPPEA